MMLHRMLSLAVLCLISVTFATLTAPSVRAGGGDEGTTILPFGGGDDNEDDENRGRGGPGHGDGGNASPLAGILLQAPSGVQLLEISPTGPSVLLRGHSSREILKDPSEDSGLDQVWQGVGIRTSELTLGFASRGSSSSVIGGRLMLMDYEGESSPSHLRLQSDPTVPGLMVLVLGQRGDGDENILQSFERVDAVRILPLSKGSVDLRKLRAMSMRLMGNQGLDLAVGVISMGDGVKQSAWAAMQLDSAENPPVFEVETPLELD